MLHFGNAFAEHLLLFVEDGVVVESRIGQVIQIGAFLKVTAFDTFGQNN